MRKVNIGDIGQLVRIEQESFSSNDYPIDEKLFRLLINNHRSVLFGAIVDGNIAGYVCLIRGKKAVLIYSIAVGEKYRGKGIGTKLLEAAEKYALDTGLNVIQLEVRCNSRAVELYQRRGYSVKKIKIRYYSDGENAYSMEKRICFRGDEDATIDFGRKRRNPAIASATF